jgi:hypothetical protein
MRSEARGGAQRRTLRQQFAVDAVAPSAHGSARVVALIPGLAERSELLQALALGFPDFEDAVQAACAAMVNADWIVTRKIKDFRKSPVAGNPPGPVLAAIRASEG